MTQFDRNTFSSLQPGLVRMDSEPNGASALARGRTRVLALLTTASLMFYLVLYLTVPISVQLMFDIICENQPGAPATVSDSNNSTCDSSAEVSSQMARINLVLGLFNTIPAFILSGFYASVADKYGRKLCMVIPTLGYSTYVAMLLILAWRRSTGNKVSIQTMEALCAVGLGSLGLSGSFSTFQMALFSYAADFTTAASDAASSSLVATGTEASERRASQDAPVLAAGPTGTASRGVIYSFIEASLFFGKTVGPLFSGLYAQGHGTCVRPPSPHACLCPTGP